MRICLLIALLTAGAAQTPTATAPVTVVGEFTNMRYTGEHAYGYSVQLWRQGDRLFGFFLASEGLAGDTPAGMLTEVQFSPLTGKLSFQAKLSIGMESLGPGPMTPSRDFFEFRGTLEKTALTGTLRRSNLLHPKAAPQTERVRLRKQASGAMLRASSYDQWKKFADQILARRGPQW